ncbi:hypothetical protein ACQCN2_16165 [Brevibacillus ginsengisoli]|uniref:hypothetical protein n=1 Tax=Brevibacillus ginsengisoli TaxID=363854 RepID=UPI003CF2085C
MKYQYQETFCYENEDGSPLFSEEQLERKELMSFEDLVDWTCVEAEVMKDTYIHVVEGVCIWEEDFEYDDDTEDFVVTEAGYELLQQVAA